MGHLGKFFPIEQKWRLYACDTETLAGFPPARVLVRAQLWLCTFTPPIPGNTWFECSPMPWTAGDETIGYQSEIISVGHPMQVGIFMHLIPPGRAVWKYAAWDSGVDQIPFGWNDQLSHFAWWPGDTRIISTFPSPGGTAYPVGVVEVKAKPWP